MTVAHFKCPACAGTKGFRLADKPKAKNEFPEPVCRNCGHQVTPDEVKDWLNDYFRFRT
jgi:hypothetical protein